MSRLFQEMIQEEMDEATADLYKHLAEQMYAPSYPGEPAPSAPKPTLRQRISWRVWSVRLWLASKLAGYDVEER